MRIRDIARIDGFPCGEYNAVTDVKGVRVGHSTVIKDGAGPVEGIARTGVTVVLPAGDIVENAMYAGVCGPSICAPLSIRRRPARWRKAASAAAPA